MEDARSFKIGEREFQLSKIDALKQFHIVRRIGPILADTVQSLKGLAGAKMDAMTDAQKLEQFAAIAEPIMQGLSKLPDADAEFVLMTLLASAEVKQPQFGSWAKVSNGMVIAMQDLELPTLLQVAGKALMFNLAGFFALLPRPASGELKVSPK